MVRKAALITLALASGSVAQESEPWRNYWPEDALWGAQTSTNDVYWIMEKDINRNSNLAGGVEFWMHGYHAKNPDVKYRRSLWKIRLTCQGTFYTKAVSQMDAQDRSVYEWDGYGTSVSIRPNTIYEPIQDKLCPK